MSQHEQRAVVRETASLTSGLGLLYRRAGFGASPAVLAAASARGYTATVEELVGGLALPDPGADAVTAPDLQPPPADLGALRGDPAAQRALLRRLIVERVALTDWWLARMVASTNPLREKLTFLLHGHFPTAISKVRFPLYMYGQNQVFRAQGAGAFDALTQSVATDPAMLIWLDAAFDKAADPNENFARELLERFTMGIGTYSERDVRAAATCFTGWRLDRRTGTFVMDAAQHDGRPQNFLGQRSVTSGQQVIEIATHSDASSRFVPAAFWSHLAYPVGTGDPVVADLARGYAADRRLDNLLRAIFSHPEFVSTRSAFGLVKQPTEYVVGALRALGVAPSALVGRGVQVTLAGLGQVLFDPPSVGGWPQNTYWLSTAAALSRWDFARRLTSVADLSVVADQQAGSRMDATATLLGVPSWSASTARALRGATGDPATLVTLALVSPEYVSN